MKRLGCVLMMTLMGCLEASVYDLEAISGVELRKGEGKSRSLTYQVKMETLYHSPGVLHTKQGGKDVFQFVRCKIGEQCHVDIASDSSKFPQKITLPEGTSSTILLMGANGQTQEIASPK